MKDLLNQGSTVIYNSHEVPRNHTLKTELEKSLTITFKDLVLDLLMLVGDQSLPSGPGLCS